MPVNTGVIYGGMGSPGKGVTEQRQTQNNRKGRRHF